MRLLAEVEYIYKHNVVSSPRALMSDLPRIEGTSHIAKRKPFESVRVVSERPGRGRKD